MSQQWQLLKCIVTSYRDSVTDEAVQDAYAVILSDMEHIEKTLETDGSEHMFKQINLLRMEVGRERDMRHNLETTLTLLYQTGKRKAT